MDRQRNVDLSSFNTLGLRSCARDLLVYDNVTQLPGLQALTDQGERIFVLGGGSNVVLAEQVDAVVLKVES